MQWFDGQGVFAALQPVPVLDKLITMQLGPSLDYSPRTPRKRAGYQVHGIEPEDSNVIAAIRMKVRQIEF